MKLPPMAVGFLLLALACESATGPAATLVVTTPPNFAAVVTSKAHSWLPMSCPELASPCSGGTSVYVLWTGIPLSSAGTEVTVDDSAPVFVRNRFGLVRTTAAGIRLRDSIETWPAGVQICIASGNSPCFTASQIVIIR